MNTTLQLTKQLISIPSYVRDEINEAKIADLIYNLLKKEGFLVEKQLVEKGRWNIIATIGKPRLWLCGHMDTIEPKSKSRLIPRIKEGNLYGLGALDMKAGIAAIIGATASAKLKNNLGLLFYCDEEYAFKGMQKFLETFSDKPELTIITEPTNLQISNAHRGILEIYAVVKGKSGHASRPDEGINAISGVSELVESLSEILKNDYSGSLTGRSTCTLSKIIGGTNIGKDDEKINYAQGTNSIPDTAEIWLDIRPATFELNGEKVKELLKKFADPLRLTIPKFVQNQNFGPLLTNPSTIKPFEKVVTKAIGKADYLPAQKMGYGDGQLFFAKTKTPVIYFGPGPTQMCHKDGEYVTIADIIKTETVLRKTIELFSKE